MKYTHTLSVTQASKLGLHLCQYSLLTCGNHYRTIQRNGETRVKVTGEEAKQYEQLVGKAEEL